MENHEPDDGDYADNSFGSFACWSPSGAERKYFSCGACKDITPASYDIAFQDVSFGYDKRTVLHDVSFKIPQNTTTAIVGPSGSGKSTLCSLIARFYDVNTGSITLGGTDIRKFTCDSLLKNISMVFQNVYLFRDTIKNNIKFGSPGATDEQIIAAAKEARCPMPLS